MRALQRTAMEQTPAADRALRPPPFRRRLRKYDPLLIVLGVVALAVLGFMLWQLAADGLREAEPRPAPAAPAPVSAPADSGGELERSLSHEILIRERERRTTDDEAQAASPAARAAKEAQPREALPSSVLSDWRSSIERMRGDPAAAAPAADADRGAGQPAPAVPEDPHG